MLSAKYQPPCSDLNVLTNWGQNKKPFFVQIMAWHQTGSKSLFEPMMTEFTGAYIVSLGLNELTNNNMHYPFQSSNVLIHIP